LQKVSRVKHFRRKSYLVHRTQDVDEREQANAGDVRRATPKGNAAAAATTTTSSFTSTVSATRASVSAALSTTAICLLVYSSKGSKAEEMARVGSELFVDFFDTAWLVVIFSV